MDKEDKANKNDDTCGVQGCGCSVNYIILGLLVLVLLISVAAIVK